MNTAITCTFLAISENLGDFILHRSHITQRHTNFLSKVVADLGLSGFETDFVFLTTPADFHYMFLSTIMY